MGPPYCVPIFIVILSDHREKYGHSNAAPVFCIKKKVREDVLGRLLVSKQLYFE